MRMSGICPPVRKSRPLPRGFTLLELVVVVAIVGAEYVTRLVPAGTHEYERLIRPSELAAWARGAGLEAQEIAGLEFNPVTSLCRLTADPSVNYLLHLRKPVS